MFTEPHYNDEAKAREYLEALRWPNGIVCPHCGTIDDHPYRLQGKAHRPGLMACKSCRQQFSVTVGTVFERSKIPLTTWLKAFYLIAASKKGMSSHQLHRMLGVTYKTAWFMTHRIREAMKDTNGGLLGSDGGPVEVDETFWGNEKGKEKKAAWHHKMKVVSLVERDGDKRSFHVARVHAKTLRPILMEQISKNARLMTDEAHAYKSIGHAFAEHGVVNHKSKEYARGDITTNTVESSFAILKRGLYGTFHHVGEQHLQRYATEFDFRWNHRKTTDAERTVAALRGIEGKRLTYRQPN